jgi:superfamily II DNA helicase RecQ
MTPTKMLRNFIGESAIFRGNQEEVINAIIQGRQYVLQIAATGVGKSLSFMLPAYITISGTTIVVVPSYPLIGFFEGFQSPLSRLFLIVLNFIKIMLL